MVTFSRLSTRYDSEIDEPADFDLRYTINDLFNGISPAPDETPSAWFASGCINGDATPFHTLVVERSGTIKFQFWPDANETPGYEHIAQVTESEAHLLWHQLSKRKIDSVLAWFAARQ